MLKLNHRFNHLVEAVNSACSAPLTFQWEWIIIIACCVLGLIWAVYNIFLVLQIKVGKGITGDREDDNRGKDIPQHQKDLLIELGEKISEVKFLLNLGSQRILESRISYLFDLRRYHVRHYYLFDLRRIEDWYCFRCRCLDLNRLWRHWYDHCHSS